jgi:hypothetical protein
MTLDTGAAPAVAPASASHEHVPLLPALWFTVVAVAMAGVIPTYLVFVTPLLGRESAAWPTALGVTVLAGVRFAWLVAQGRLRLFEIVFWLFTYVFLGLAPLSQMRSGSYPGTTPFLHEDLNGHAALVVWVGLVAFIVGVFLATIRRQPADGDRRIQLVAPHRLTILTTIVLLVCAYYLVRTGFSSLFLSRLARSRVESAAFSNSTINSIVKAFVSFAPVVAFAAIMRLRRQRSVSGDVPPVVFAWVLALLTMLIDNPISTPRYVTGTAVLGIIVALGGASTPRRLRILSISLVAGLVLVFPLLDMFRYTTSPGDTTPTSFSETLQTADFDAFDQVNNSVLFVQTEGVRSGQQLLGAAFFFVPRAVWETKADDTGVLLANFRGYKVTNLSAPVWTELYVDGAWGLLALGMMALGYVLRRADDAAVALFRVFPAPGVLSGTLPFYLIIMLRGSLLQSMASFTVIVACAALVGRRVPASRLRQELTSR